MISPSTSCFNRSKFNAVTLRAPRDGFAIAELSKLLPNRPGDEFNRTASINADVGMFIGVGCGGAEPSAAALAATWVDLSKEIKPRLSGAPRRASTEVSPALGEDDEVADTGVDVAVWEEVGLNNRRW